MWLAVKFILLILGKFGLIGIISASAKCIFNENAEPSNVILNTLPQVADTFSSYKHEDNDMNYDSPNNQQHSRNGNIFYRFGGREFRLSSVILKRIVGVNCKPKHIGHVEPPLIKSQIPHSPSVLSILLALNKHASVRLRSIASYDRFQHFPDLLTNLRPYNYYSFQVVPLVFRSLTNNNKNEISTSVSDGGKEKGLNVQTQTFDKLFTSKANDNLDFTSNTVYQGAGLEKRTLSSYGTMPPYNWRFPTYHRNPCYSEHVNTSGVYYYYDLIRVFRYLHGYTGWADDRYAKGDNASRNEQTAAYNAVEKGNRTRVSFSDREFNATQNINDTREEAKPLFSRTHNKTGRDNSDLEKQFDFQSNYLYEVLNSMHKRKLSTFRSDSTKLKNTEVNDFNEKYDDAQKRNSDTQNLYFENNRLSPHGGLLWSRGEEEVPSYNTNPAVVTTQSPNPKKDGRFIVEDTHNQAESDTFHNEPQQNNTPQHYVSSKEAIWKSLDSLAKYLKNKYTSPPTTASINNAIYRANNYERTDDINDKQGAGIKFGNVYADPEVKD